MNVFDQYGIKEVADVQIFSIHKKTDGSGDVYYVPALYLNTTKVNTIEQSGETSWATGGRGNSKLIGWDHSKNINLSLTDALCSPASLGLCWGGRLSANWKDGDVDIKSGINKAVKGYERISRMESAYYPKYDGGISTIADNIPHIDEDVSSTTDGTKLKKSAILDGVDIHGYGQVAEKPYKWKLQIDSRTKSVAFVPNKFFSIYGKEYPIKQNQVIGINQSTDAFKYEIIYKRDYKSTVAQKDSKSSDIYHRQDEQGIEQLVGSTVQKQQVKELEYLEKLNPAGNGYHYDFIKIRVCHDGSVRTYVSRHWNQIFYSSESAESSATPAWDSEDTKSVINIITGGLGLKTIDEKAVSDFGHQWVEVSIINQDQFRGQELWVQFNSLNALSYYLLTKYEQDVYSIAPKDIKITQTHWTRAKLRKILFGENDSASGVVYSYPGENSVEADNKRKALFKQQTNKDLEANYVWSWDKTKGVIYNKVKKCYLQLYFGAYVKSITLKNTPVTYDTVVTTAQYDNSGEVVYDTSPYTVNWFNILMKLVGSQILAAADEQDLTENTVVISGEKFNSLSTQAKYFLASVSSNEGKGITVTSTQPFGQAVAVTSDYDATSLDAYLSTNSITGSIDVGVRTTETNGGAIVKENLLEFSNPYSPEEYIKALLICNKPANTSGVRPSQNSWHRISELTGKMWSGTLPVTGNHYDNIVGENLGSYFIPYRYIPEGSDEYVYNALTVSAYNSATQEVRKKVKNGNLYNMVQRAMWYDILEYLEVFNSSTTIDNQIVFSKKNELADCFAYKILASGKIYYLVNTVKLGQILTEWERKIRMWENRKEIMKLMANYLTYDRLKAINVRVLKEILSTPGAAGDEQSGNIVEDAAFASTITDQVITNSVNGHSDIGLKIAQHKEALWSNFVSKYEGYNDGALGYRGIISPGTPSRDDSEFFVNFVKLAGEGIAARGTSNTQDLVRLLFFNAIDLVINGIDLQFEKGYDLTTPITSIDFYNYFITNAESNEYRTINNLLNTSLDIMTREFNPANEKSVAYNCGITYSLVDPEELLLEKTNAPAGKYDFLSRNLWAYVNPRTMKPYDDDYWFKSGEPYYKKSLTLATKSNPLSTKKIFVEAGRFPGMYKIVCEALIRRREDGNDEHMQIVLPLCKIKCNQSLQLSADGEPTTYNFEVEVATPNNNIPIEMNFYETTTETTQEFTGGQEVKDGSTIVRMD